MTKCPQNTLTCRPKADALTNIALRFTQHGESVCARTLFLTTDIPRYFKLLYSLILPPPNIKFCRDFCFFGVFFNQISLPPPPNKKIKKRCYIARLNTDNEEGKRNTFVSLFFKKIIVFLKIDIISKLMYLFF